MTQHVHKWIIPYLAERSTSEDGFPTVKGSCACGEDRMFYSDNSSTTTFNSSLMKGVTYNFSCSICNEAFIARNRNAMYCSEPCARKAAQVRYSQNKDQYNQNRRINRAPPLAERDPRSCAECKTMFQPRQHNSKYCSEPCASRASSRRKRAKARLAHGRQQ